MRFVCTLEQTANFCPTHHLMTSFYNQDGKFLLSHRAYFILI